MYLSVVDLQCYVNFRYQNILNEVEEHIWLYDYRIT